MKTLLTALTATLIGLTLPAPAPAQWGNTPDDPVPICTAEGDQVAPRLIRLGTGRYLITWGDRREGYDNSKTYYQLLDKYGVPLLENNGVKLVPTATWYTGAVYLLPDTQGGCFCVFYDDRNGAGVYDIYGQRFDSLGNRLWGETGLPLILWPGASQIYLSDAETDTLGNLFLIWSPNISPYAYIYAQKSTISGQLLWGNYGLQVCESTWTCPYQLIPDNQGGVIAVWTVGNETDYVWAQHLDSDGDPLWIVNGIPLINPQGFQIQCSIMQILSDGSGGGICVGTRSGYGYNYARIFRVNGQTGAVPWYKSWGAENSSFVDALRHPADGTIYALRNGSSSQSHLHRWSVQGTALLGPDGLTVTNIGAGGSLTATNDGVIVLGKTAHNYAMLAQRYDSAGQTLWSPSGALVYHPSNNFGDWVACSDGEDGLVVVIRDDNNLFAQRLRGDGNLGNVMPPYPYAPIYTQRQLYLQGNTIVFHLPQAEDIRLELYDLLGRKVLTFLEGYHQAGDFTAPLNTAGLPSGLYFLHLSTPAEQQTVKALVLR